MSRCISAGSCTALICDKHGVYAGVAGLETCRYPDDDAALHKPDGERAAGTGRGATGQRQGDPD